MSWTSIDRTISNHIVQRIHDNHTSSRAPVHSNYSFVHELEWLRDKLGVVAASRFASNMPLRAYSPVACDAEVLILHWEGYGVDQGVNDPSTRTAQFWTHGPPAAQEEAHGHLLPRTTSVSRRTCEQRRRGHTVHLQRREEAHCPPAPANYIGFGASADHIGSASIVPTPHAISGGLEAIQGWMELKILKAQEGNSTSWQHRFH
jgi:hypothetical protein